MKCILYLGIVIWLVSSPPLFAQTNLSSSEQKQQPPVTSTVQEQQSPTVRGRSSAVRFNDLSSRSAIQHAELEAAQNLGQPMEAVDVLNDTMGVDFSPYLRSVVKRVKQKWYKLIPEDARLPLMKKGNVAIEFMILKDGSVSDMKLVEGGSSGDPAMDRAAWDGIGASNPFPPLPSEFPGLHLALRFHFFYNPDTGAIRRTQVARSGITVTISPRRGQLAANSQQTFSANVIGTSNRAVIWSVIRLDCSGAHEQCGTISPSGLYVAPQKVRSPVFVKVKAVSEAGSDSFDSVTVRVSPASSATVTVQPNP
ncbi:MAG TPA: TonB family protein [Terriglobales bacterium]|jgi:TonB family protein|nr:TonB family protein [Terriglobales bacterium]